jgi:hypothetical protein
LDTGTSIIEGTPAIVEGLISAAGLPPVNEYFDCSLAENFPEISF